MLPAGHLTQLEGERHGSAYLRRLAHGLDHSRAWLCSTGTALAFFRQNRRGLDDALANYVQACFASNVGVTVQKHAVSALQR